MPIEATGRKYLSDLIAATGGFEDNKGVNYYFATVDAKAASSTDIDPIGTPMVWDSATSAYVPFAAPDDWAAGVVTAVGDVVKPTSRDGYEYVCITAGTTNDTEGEPTWVPVEGATTTETDGVVWIAREPYSGSDGSVPDGAELVITVGEGRGKGLNKEDVTLTSTATEMRVMYRGSAILLDDAIEWSTLSVAAADQTEAKGQFERQGMSVVDAATEVIPSYVS